MNVSDAINLVLALINNAASISGLIQKAQGEGRSTLTADEWAQITAADDAARAALVKAIA